LNFKDILGHENLKSQLLGAIQHNHVAHAQLFAGQEGSANLALALAYAQRIHCETPTSDDACGSCPSCKKHIKGIHPDMHFVFPVAITKKVESKPLSQDFMKEWREIISPKKAPELIAKDKELKSKENIYNLVAQNPYISLKDWLTYIEAEDKQANISAEEGRQILQKLMLKSFEGGYKILLLWLPEFLNITSANVLLKILEEPPAKTLFLWVTNDANNLLTTLISRLQRVQIMPFEDVEVEEYLKTKKFVPKDKAQNIAYLSEGNLGLALRMNMTAEADFLDWFRDWMRECYKINNNSIVGILEKMDIFNEMPKETQKNLLQYAINVCREMMIIKNINNTSDSESFFRLPPKKLEFIQNISKSFKNITQWESLYKHFNQAIYHIERNANAKMLFLDMSLKISVIFLK
jgi:DNA polymerase III subunit delta'